MTHGAAKHSSYKLSWLRVLLACMIFGLSATTLGYGWQQHQEYKYLATIEPWFAPYVDVTSTPQYAFEQLGSTKTPDVMLAFIVSLHDDPCQPAWGSVYSLDEAAASLDVDRRIARLQQQGGRVAISFGGAINNELALMCTDHDQLKRAYQSVIDRYNIDTIDLDLENAGLTDQDALKRRADVIAELQKERRSRGKSLAVWLTLPVAPQGLTPDGTSAVARMLASGVDISGVNVMTMDYGASKEGYSTMFSASKSALTQTHRQLGILYKQANISLNSASLWKKIGATPMIGQNDVHDEVFTLEDARELNTFAQRQGIGRMSMWSANRDLPCGENYVDIKIVSDSCSGVKTEKGMFALTLGENFDGDLTQNATIVTLEDPISAEQIADDPEKSPYQIWKETGAYLAGTKVVWHGNVYEAKWWTKGDMPDNPVLQSWETPWQLIGPVLPGEKPIVLPTLPPGTYTEWSGTVEYQTGERVLFEGNPYQAKWWNQGQSPAAAAAHADSSPWVPLSQEEVYEIIENSTASAGKKQ